MAHLVGMPVRLSGVRAPLDGQIGKVAKFEYMTNEVVVHLQLMPAPVRVAATNVTVLGRETQFGPLPALDGLTLDRSDEDEDEGEAGTAHTQFVAAARAIRDKDPQEEPPLLDKRYSCITGDDEEDGAWCQHEIDYYQYEGTLQQRAAANLRAEMMRLEVPGVETSFRLISSDNRAGGAGIGKIKRLVSAVATNGKWHDLTVVHSHWSAQVIRGVMPMREPLECASPSERPLHLAATCHR